MVTAPRSAKRRACEEPDATNPDSSRRKRARQSEEQPQPAHRYNLRRQRRVSYSNTCTRQRKRARTSRPPAPRNASKSQVAPPLIAKSAAMLTPAATPPSARCEAPNATPPVAAHSAQRPVPVGQPSPPYESERHYIPGQPFPPDYVPDEPLCEPDYPYDIEDLDEPRPYERLPLLEDFSCTFVRQIQTTDTAAVLLVEMADSTLRILKLFIPQPPRHNDPFTSEYQAYAALRHHGVCTPPDASATTRRVVPFCYGALILRAWSQVSGISGWKTGFRETHRLSLLGLLIEYIPNAPSIMASPDRLARRPELVDNLMDALRHIHSAGVLHEDPLPRNMLIDDTGGVWWVDFGCAATTAYCQIDRWWFQGEGWRVKTMLRDDVIPACLEGRTPEWRMMGL